MKKLDNQELHKLMGGGIDPGKGDYENSIYTLAGATRFEMAKKKKKMTQNLTKMMSPNN